MDPDTRGVNPFSTRFVRPGAIPYFFPPGQEVSDVLRCLAENGWCGQIVGPHGSGKSTLLASLLRRVEESGKRAVLVELHDGQRRLPQNVLAGKVFMLAIDGYEQLPWWRRRWFERHCRRRGVGLLVTTHCDVGLPEIFHVHVDLNSARRVIGHLLGDRAKMITDEEIADCVGRHGADLREALFELYDLFEKQRRKSDQPTR